MSRAEKLVRLCNILTLSNVLGVKKSSVTNRANQMQLTMKNKIRMDKKRSNRQLCWTENKIALAGPTHNNQSQ